MIKKIIPIVTIVLVGMFVIIDIQYVKLISEAVSLKEGVYSELYGPISFFREILLYLSALFSVVTSVLLLKK